MNKKRILLTGASGFLGSAVLEALIREENTEKIIVLDKEPPQIRGEYEFIEGDVTNIEVVNSIEPVEVIYHFAAIANLDDSIERNDELLHVNIMGLINILNLARETGIEKFMYASSMYVFNNIGNFYGVSKKCGELLVEEYSKNYGFDFVHLRYGSLYGKGAQQWNSIRKYITTILNEQKVEYWGTGEEKRDYIHIEDAARLSLEAMDEKYLNQALTITGQQTKSSKEIFEMIFEMLDMKPDIKYLNQVEGFHYSLSPYKYKRERSIKLVSNSYIDIGQGMYEIIKELDE